MPRPYFRTYVAAAYLIATPAVAEVPAVVTDFAPVQSLAAKVMGIDPGRKDEILSILSLAWEPGEDGTGRLVLILAGDGAVALEVEALDARLEDVTRPYIAPSRHVPDHGA